MKVTGITHKDGMLFKFYINNKLVDFLHVDFTEKDKVDYLVFKKRSEHVS